MKIESIKRDGNSVNIQMEDGSSLKLQLSILKDENISEGLNLSENEVDNLLNKAELIKAKNSALRILSRRSHSEFELRKKLSDKKYSAEVISRVIADMAAIGFINDEKFANDYYESCVRLKGDGINKIVNKLMLKGIKKSLITEIISAKEDESIHLENALKLTERKIQFISNKDLPKEKIRAKIMLYLQNKGFSYDVITKVLKTKKLY